MLDYLRNLLTTRRDEEKGASAVEYGLLVAGIAALVVLVIFAFGGIIKNVFSTTCSKISAGASVSGSCS